MRATHIELAELFPGKADRINALMTEDTRFRSLCAKYQELLETTRRCATDAVFTGPRQIEELRDRRRILAEAISDSLRQPVRSAPRPEAAMSSAGH